MVGEHPRKRRFLAMTSNRLGASPVSRTAR
jgi:hypothetical protein